MTAAGAQATTTLGQAAPLMILTPDGMPLSLPSAATNHLLRLSCIYIHMLHIYTDILIPPDETLRCTALRSVGIYHHLRWAADAAAAAVFGRGRCEKHFRQPVFSPNLDLDLA